jgi:hypothetical protein
VSVEPSEVGSVKGTVDAVVPIEVCSVDTAFVLDEVADEVCSISDTVLVRVVSSVDATVVASVEVVTASSSVTVTVVVRRKESFSFYIMSDIRDLEG